MTALYSNQVSVSNSFQRRKYYVVAIAVIAIAVIGIPLGVSTLGGSQKDVTMQISANYAVGEKMVYTTIIGMASYDSTDFAQTSQSNPPTMPVIDIIEVIDFDGEYYTLNHTMTTNSVTEFTLEKIRIGELSTQLINLNSPIRIPQNNDDANDAYIAQLLSKSELKVGNTLTVPYTSSFVSTVTGDLKISFKGYEDLMTPAGTFRVAKVEITGENLSSRLDTNTPEVYSATTMDLDYTLYLELDSTRIVKSTMSYTVFKQISNPVLYPTEQHQTDHMTIEKTLEQIIKP